MCFTPTDILGTMEELNNEGRKKKQKKSLGEIHQEMTFKIEPSDAPAKAIDTSEWPLLLKVNSVN